MKPEELFDTMSAIDDDILERSERNKVAAVPDRVLAAGETSEGETAAAKKLTDKTEDRKNRIRMIRIWSILAVAAAILIAVAIIAPKIVERNLEKANGTPTPAVTVAAVEPGNFYGQEGTEQDKLMAKYLLAKATYPEKADFPNFEDFVKLDGSVDFESYDSAYREWEEKAFANQAGIKQEDRVRAHSGVEALVTAGLAQLLAGEESTNRLCSPANLYVALAMLAETTDGNSRAQILNLLGVSDIETLRGLSDVTWNILYRNSGVMTRVLASSLWLRDDAQISYIRSTIDRLADTYHASTFKGTMGSAEYDQAFQAWLNEQTGGLLKDSVANQNLDPKTAIALATTIYFSAKWDAEFSESRTDKQVFHAKSGDIETDFMHQKIDNSAYVTGDKFSAVYKYFEGGQFGNMVFFLPDEGVTADELLSDPQVLSIINGTLGTARITVINVNYSIPKFDVTSDIDLSECFKKLGITDVFSAETADFSSIAENSGGMFLSKVDHSVRVQIDEEGVKAAAYTVMPSAGALPPSGEEVDFVLDRPFVFAIRSETGIPLFVGVVELP